MEDKILAIISIILGSISILGLIAAAAYWKGTLDSTLKELKDTPTRTSSLELKMDVVWSLLVDQILVSKPNLANRGSGYKVTDCGEEVVKEFEPVLQLFKDRRCSIMPSDALTFIVNEIGLVRVKEVAHKYNMTTGEIFSLLTVGIGVDI